MWGPFKDFDLIGLKDEEDLTNHTAFYHTLDGGGDNNRPCDECDYVATKLGDLKRHKNELHGGYKYECDHCDYTCSDSSNMNKHRKSRHEGMFYTCSECEFVGTTMSTLNRNGVAENRLTRHVSTTSSVGYLPLV